MRQARTAIDVYRHDIRPTLQGRQLFVRQQLEQFIIQYNVDPTAKELLVYIASKFPQAAFDLNTVRPRLTEMHEQGWVCHAGKRICRVTSRCVYTWGLSKPRPPSMGAVQKQLGF